MIFTCDMCGNDFEGIKRFAKWRFCSHTCLTRARHRDGPIGKSRQARVYVKQCLHCKDEFSYTKHSKKLQYCTRKCAAAERKAGGIIAQKVDATTFKHWGVKRGLHIPENKLRANSENACKKRHETMKRNGTFKKPSKSEVACYDALCEIFGADDVHQQVLMNERWPIDFYVVSIDTYVQEDGVYWHGLDRPIEEIALHKTKKDVNIYQKWKVDRVQDEWFEQAGKRLVRLTDLEIKQWQKEKKIVAQVKTRLMI